MRLIDADELLKAIANSGLIWETNECLDVIETLAVKKIIDDAPTVVPEEMKPLIEKVVEIIPQLTDAIVEQLPEVVENGLDLCYDCEYRRKARGDV